MSLRKPMTKKDMELVKKMAFESYTALLIIWNPEILGDWAMPATPQGDAWEALRRMAVLFNWEKMKKEGVAN